LGLFADRLALTGRLWDAIGALNANLKDFGFVIIGVFLAAWVLSYLIYRFTDLDEVEVRVADPASPQ
jgi:high-affinity nickel-transport protein